MAVMCYERAVNPDSMGIAKWRSLSSAGLVLWRVLAQRMLWCSTMQALTFILLRLCPGDGPLHPGAYTHDVAGAYVLIVQVAQRSTSGANICMNLVLYEGDFYTPRMGQQRLSLLPPYTLSAPVQSGGP